MHNIFVKIEKGAFYMFIALFLTLTLAACVQKLNVDTNGYYTSSPVVGKGVNCVKIEEYYIKCGSKR